MSATSSRWRSPTRRSQARDAAELIGVAWEELPAAVDMEEAVQPGAPLVFAGAPGNVAYDTHIGDKQKTDAAFEAAAHRVRIRIVNPRAVANYMEPRSAVGEYDPSDRPVDAERRQLRACTASQGRDRRRDLEDPAGSLRVVTQDVGGGFGTKAFVYREYPLVLEAARRLGRRVGWQADRTEHFVGDAQGRDNVTTAEMALDAEGRFLALRVDILGNLGAYLSHVRALYSLARRVDGDRALPHRRALRARSRRLHPYGSCRRLSRGGAAGGGLRARAIGRRLREVARDRARRAACAATSSSPSRCPITRTPIAITTSAISRARCAPVSRRRTAPDSRGGRRNRGARGKIRGFGVSSYIECTAWGDAEQGSVTLEKNGDFTVLIGTQSNGQGHETAYAQVVSQYLDVPLERIKVVQGDTDRVATGAGTGASRSIPIGAVMVTRASQTLAASLKDLAADKLEAAVADLEIADGSVRIAGTDRAISYAEIAALPAATAAKLTAIEFVHTAERHLSQRHPRLRGRDRSRDRRDAIVRYTVVDDFGFTLNPLLLAGQVHGGIAQGVGQALMERAVYDENGQLLTASFMDYCMPRADDLPEFDFETRNIPSTTNPIGLKGAGEAGSIGSTPAVMNAVADALVARLSRRAHRHAGDAFRRLQREPATPFAVYSVIKRSRAEP